MRLNIFGFRYGDSGWSQHARSFAAALGSRHDVGVVAWNHPCFGDPDPALTDQPLPDVEVEVAIGPIERMDEMTASRRIGYVTWETTVMPDDKLRILHALSEVWTPSTWGREILIANGLPTENVHVVPEGVDPTVFRPNGGRRPEAPRVFRFLCVGKWEKRKGIADLLRAYSREFDASEPVELVLHCFDPRLGLRAMGVAIRALDLPDPPPIRISEPKSRAEMVDLYNASDVFVLPTKAEGWGLPIVEAMSCALPVIVTNYSAPTDYVNDDNGYLVDVAEMVPVSDERYFRFETPLGVWAQPEPRHLQELMRRTFRESAERTEKADRARQDILAGWTWEHSALAASRRLDAGS